MWGSGPAMAQGGLASVVSTDDHVSRVPGHAKDAHDGDAVHSRPLLLAVADADGVLVEEVVELWVQPERVDSRLQGIVL